MALSDKETEYEPEDDEWEYACEHDKWEDEDCAICDAEDVDADSDEGADEPADEVTPNG